MNISAILILASFAGIAIFGFLSMNHEAIGNCLASLVHGTKCLSTNPVEVANFHINTFKSFSTAVFVLTAFLAAVFLTFAVSTLAAVAKPFAGFLRPISVHPSVFTSQLTFLSWLAFHENSPTFH